MRAVVGSSLVRCCFHDAILSIYETQRNCLRVARPGRPPRTRWSPLRSPRRIPCRASTCGTSSPERYAALAFAKRARFSGPQEFSRSCGAWNGESRSSSRALERVAFSAVRFEHPRYQSWWSATSWATKSVKALRELLRLSRQYEGTGLGYQ